MLKFHEVSATTCTVGTAYMINFNISMLLLSNNCVPLLLSRNCYHQLSQISVSPIQQEDNTIQNIFVIP